jgi:hypothetical protein
MNFGQMLMWHIVLIPIVLIAIVGAHMLLVRVHGVSHPINAHAAEVTAASELNGTSETATYGPPYNNQNGSVQKLLFSPQTIPGVTQPVNAAQDFVLGPLATLAATDPGVAAPLAAYRAAPAAQQLKWANAYGNAVVKVKFVNGSPVVPAASDGPVATRSGSCTARPGSR